MSGSIWNICAHSETTPADEDGQGLCLKCGGVVQLRLTRALMDRTFEMINRDFGPYGRHTMRCVDTPDGWVCDTNCTIRR